MKKIILIALFFAPFYVAPHVFAQTSGTFVPLSPIPGLTDLQPTQGGLADFFNNLYKYLIGLSAALAVIMIIWGGLEYSTTDSVGNKEEGKKHIRQAIFGLVLVLSPVLVFSIINPNILNLSVNLPPLESGTSAPTNTGGTTTATSTTSSGCVVTGNSGDVLQYAICPSSDAATQWGQTCSDNLSQTYPYSTGAGGQTAQYLILCSTKNQYTFIETLGGLSSINKIQPLAKTDANPNNASQAIRFANMCAAVGSEWATCISDLPITTSSVPCSPKPTTLIPSSSGGSGKCYNETLSCVKSAGFGARCDTQPKWSPFN